MPKKTSASEKAVEVVRILATHPSIAALGVMVTCVAAQVALGADDGSAWKTNAKHHISGLYNGAQGIIIGSFAVPIIQTVGEMVQPIKIGK